MNGQLFVFCFDAAVIAVVVFLFLLLPLLLQTNIGTTGSQNCMLERGPELNLQSLAPITASRARESR